METCRLAAQWLLLVLECPSLCTVTTSTAADETMQKFLRTLLIASTEPFSNRQRPDKNPAIANLCHKTGFEASLRARLRLAANNPVVVMDPVFSAEVAWLAASNRAWRQPLVRSLAQWLAIGNRQGA